MPLEPLSPAAFALIARVAESYAGLMQSAPGLGGKLLYAGELDEPGRAIVVAANIAGAATLAASADQSARKQAMRDGIVDFLVTSLDEALRILKNQIRRRETVAVCVGAGGNVVEHEMRERGVAPDLVFPGSPGNLFDSFQSPARVLEAPAATGKENQTWLTWRVESSPAAWLPKLDAIALECLPPEDAQARRWLERAPRYLGRLAQNLRVLRTTEEFANRFLAQIENGLASGAIGVPVEIIFGPGDHPRTLLLAPGRLTTDH